MVDEDTKKTIHARYEADLHGNLVPDDSQNCNLTQTAESPQNSTRRPQTPDEGIGILCHKCQVKWQDKKGSQKHVVLVFSRPGRSQGLLYKQPCD